MEFTTAKAGIKLMEQSHRKMAIASKTDPVRRNCDLGEASGLADQSLALLTPSQPLKTGLGVWAAEHFDRIPTELFDTVFDSPL
jgi:hypothetical protein